MLPGPEQRGETHIPERDLLGRIPHLVNQAVSGRSDRARHARKQLIQAANAYSFYDFTPIVIAQAQEAILANPNQRLGQGIGFMTDFIHQTGAVTHNGLRTLRFTNEVRNAVRKMGINHTKLMQNHRIAQAIAGTNYESLIKVQLAPLEQMIAKGADSVQLSFLRPLRPGEDKEERNRILQLANEWELRVQTLLENPNERTVHEHTEERDELVSILKEEPQQSILSEAQIYTQEHAGLSLKTIEDLSYPLSEKDADRITHYLIDVFLKSHDRTKELLVRLFLTPTFFRSTSTKREYSFKHRKLLSVINYWQNSITETLTSPQDNIRGVLTESFIKALPSFRSRADMLTLPYYYTAAIFEISPQTPPEDQEEKLKWIDTYPLSRKALTVYRQNNPEDVFAFNDEIGLQYFTSTLLPEIESNISQINTAGQFAEPLRIVKKLFSESFFLDEHMNTIERLFVMNCGEEFLKNLSAHSDALETVRQKVWDDTERGFHFLPLDEMNTIIFEKDSVPEILGLENIKIVVSGTPQQWHVSVHFGIKDSLISILGSLDQNGRLLTKAPIDQKIPGLYTMLNNIAVLIFHDLVTQKKNEDNQTTTRKKSQGTQNAPQQKPDSTPEIKQNRTLPRGRTQSANTLIHDAHTEKTNYTPRTVDLYKRRLAFVKDYIEAIKQYNEAVARGASDEEMIQMKSLLESTRKKAFKPAGEKIRTVPLRFVLDTIEDPETKEKRWLETWVAKHSSPKPTEEELASPVKIYERYYKGSSALAFLDQIKPWFVGKS